jgi:hypothetical protein
MQPIVIADYSNNIVTNNGIGIWGCDGIWLDYNDVWNNVNIDYYLVNPGPNDISADPKFVNESQNDYHLRQNSPCIDAGNPMIFYNDIDTSRNDMGVYGGPEARP